MKNLLETASVRPLVRPTWKMRSRNPLFGPAPSTNFVLVQTPVYNTCEKILSEMFTGSKESDFGYCLENVSCSFKSALRAITLVRFVFRTFLYQFRPFSTIFRPAFYVDVSQPFLSHFSTVFSPYFDHINQISTYFDCVSTVFDRFMTVSRPIFF